MTNEKVVITGIGLVTSNGFGREAVWAATQHGVSGIRRLEEGELPGVQLNLGAPVSVDLDFPEQTKVIRLAHLAAEEALFDSGVDVDEVESSRFGCAISGHMGDVRWWKGDVGFQEDQWLPISACRSVADRFGLLGPRFVHSTACASGLVDTLMAVRAIRDGQCDIALAGSAEAIDPVFAAGFRKMRVLADNTAPEESCLPFDERRRGFVMGEGAGMFVVERLDHALARGATIYAEIVAGKMMADAHHVTSLDENTAALERLITDTLCRADLAPGDIGYVNAHGTGTEQNDLIESVGIRRAFGSTADDLCVSSLKAALGHLVNASGSVELALTVLGMRDGFAAPTLHLDRPDPRCDLDFVPHFARENRYQHAMKLSLAFGGHLVAAIVRRWNDADSGFGYGEPPVRKAA